MRHLIDVLQRHASPLAPLPTNIAPRCQRLTGVRAVLFDIYGTLIVSGSGDIGSASSQQLARCMHESLASHGIDSDGDGTIDTARFQALIREHQQRSRERGIATPEVEIRDVWRDFLGEPRARGAANAEDGADVDIEHLAADYEGRTNPIWMMPHAVEVLNRLASADYRLGIVSNAQFYTPLLFPALTGQTMEELSISPELSFFSFQHQIAKPGIAMYEQAEAALKNLGILANETLYVGNDMLNDIWGAVCLGFRTAWFAGDQRSMRAREDDPRVTGLEPDLILTDLKQLPQCLDA